MKTRKYAIGTYNPNGTKKLKKTIRKNKNYKGKLTKRNQRKSDKEKAIVMIICLVLLISNIFINTENRFTIKSGSLLEAKAKTNEQYKYQTIGEDQRHSVDYQKIEVSVEQQVRDIAKEHNFKWTDYLIRLAKCENRKFDPTVINDKGNTPSYSKDRGIFQINDYWHKEVSDECAHSIRCSTIWTMERINDGYQSEWVCDSLIN